MWRKSRPSTGARVDRNSGFPIQVVSNGVTSQGYLGYFGLQLPPQVNIASGATVQKVDYNSGSSPTTTSSPICRPIAWPTAVDVR